jgi:tetratricopeptide (TPR) repeat protein
LAAYNPYPENHIGLAHLLLRKLDWQNFSYYDGIEIAQEAVNLLETARNQSPVFDQFHLATYFDALIQAEHADIAFPLLEDTLKYSPDDQRLNFRMAEILRQRGEYDRSEDYAKRALRLGARKASLTLANIEYSRGKHLGQLGQPIPAAEKYASALTILKGFIPEYGHDEEVCDGIRSKIYRELEDWDSAQRIISKYSYSNNPYTIYELCRINIHEAWTHAENGQCARAIEILDSIILRIEGYHKHRLPPDLLRVLSEAVELRDRLKQI